MRKEEIFYDLVKDIKKQRTGRLDGKEIVSPVGRIYLYGPRRLREEFVSYLRKSQLPILSVAQTNDRGIVLFNDGTRTYDIHLDRF